MLLRHWAVFVYLLALQYASAALVNRTIDDRDGDIERGIRPWWRPEGDASTLVWVQHHRGLGSLAGSVAPYRETYTAANISVESWGMVVAGGFNFTGVAIYIYFYVPNATVGEDTVMDCTFSLDDEPIGTRFLRWPEEPRTESRLFDRLVYSREGLTNVPHSVFMRVNNGPDLHMPSRIKRNYVAFDYAIYTYNDSPSNSSAIFPPTSSPTDSPVLEPMPVVFSNGRVSRAAIAGVAVGSVFVLFAGLLLIFAVRKRIKKRARAASKEPCAIHAGAATATTSSARTSTMGPEGNGSSGSTITTVPSGSAPVQSQDQSHLVVTPFTAAAPSPSNPDPSSQPQNAVAVEDGVQRTHTHPVQTKSSIPEWSSVPAERRDELRQARQEEITKRVREVEREMSELGGGLVSRSHSISISTATPSVSVQPATDSAPSESTAPTSIRGAEGDGQSEQLQGEVEGRLREQISRMQREIDTLRENQSSDWALGLTDEPPPGYTPRGTTSTPNTR